MIKRNTMNTTSSEGVSTRRRIDNDETVTIMNVSSGQVFYTSKKSGLSFEMLEYGDVIDLDFGELKYMRASHPRYLTYPMIAIVGENAEDVVEQLGLQNVYETMIFPEDLDYVLNEMNIDEFKEVFNKATEGMKILIISTVRKRVEEGTFDSFSKIQAIEELMGISIIEE